MGCTGYVHSSVPASLSFCSLLLFPAVMALAFLFYLVWAFAFPKLPGNLLVTCLHCLPGTLLGCKYCSTGTSSYQQILFCLALHSPAPSFLPPSPQFNTLGSQSCHRLLASAGIHMLGSLLAPSGYSSSPPLAGPRVCTVGLFWDLISVMVW